jgi:hypothetical protein
VASAALTAPAQAAWGKVDICHFGDEGAYHQINVSEKAIGAHLAHGDGFAGDAVPGAEGFVFGEDCSLVAAAVDPIVPGCYGSSTGFNDLRYIGPADTAGNVITLKSSDGSCTGDISQTGGSVVIAGDAGDADLICASLGLNSSSWAGPLNDEVLGYQGFPGDAWYCGAP